jgi:hypothetical protein
MLNPSGLRKKLRKLFLGYRLNIAKMIEYNGTAAGGSLVEGQNKLRHPVYFGSRY